MARKIHSKLPLQPAESKNTSEVFAELELDFPRDEDSRLYDAIADGLDNVLWSKAEPYALSPTERLNYSWEEFCHTIKYERRYFFLQEQRQRDPEILGPEQILRLIFSSAKRAGAFVTEPAGMRLYRARRQPAGKTYATAGSLGPPPRHVAIQTNRMSPPGIVMTYVSEDIDTALAETADKPGTFAVGEFKTERDLLIFDLTRLPPVPSAFLEVPDSMEYDPRPDLIFLHAISREISRPVARDDRVHIEYVPTQVVIEYVRSTVRVDGRPVDGIRYKSSRRGATTALVLFADQDNLFLQRGERPQLYRKADENRWLRLAKAHTKKVTHADLARWAAKPRTSLFETP